MLNTLCPNSETNQINLFKYLNNQRESRIARAREAEKIRQNMEPTHKLGDEQLKMLTTTSDSHLKQRYSRKK